ncbi:MAG TPA: serine hydrolase domain-containing protein, partial [Dehalococcoidia bacterium]
MISGECGTRFGRVREEFERNFAERGDVGASVCVTVDGETVVDLWGGVANVETGAAWERDTVALVWSCTKGAMSLCAHMLVSRGLLDLDAPVARYWPEFAQSGEGRGKQDCTVRMLLNHQAGLAAVRQPLPPGGFYDWELVTNALASQEPFWEPGTRHGYHALTFGHLIGEVLRRITGTTPGAFFSKEVAEPLGIEFWIGLPEEIEPRVAPNSPHDAPTAETAMPRAVITAMTDPTSLQALVY